MDEPIKMLSSFAKYIMTVDMFPVFFLADYSIAAMLVRNDSNHLGPKFRQKHPFASWFCTVVTGLSGAFIASFLFGDPILNILQENVIVAYLTVIWYLINYSPFDIVYKVVKHPAIILPACILQECVRVRFLYLGLQSAAHLYPKAPLIIMMGGIIKGNGYGFIKVVERLFRGLWTPKTNEILELTYFAKSGAIGSVLFLLHHYKVFRISIEFLYFSIVVAFVIGRLVLMLGGVKDPLARLEAPFCRLLFGSWEEEKSTPSKLEMKEDNNNSSKPHEDNSKHNSKKNGSKKKNGNKKQD